MTTASVRTGTPVGQVLRSRARRPSRKVMRLTIATATDSNRTVSARVRLPATVPVPADPRRAAAWLSIRVMRSRTSSARKSSKSAKCRCRTPLATPASVVTARVLSALGPSRSRMRSAASNSCSRTSRRATPVGTVHLLLAVRGVARLTSGHASTRVDTCPLYRRNERPYPEASLISTDRSRSRSARTPNATTGPGPPIPKPWWTGSSPKAPGPTCSRWAAGPASSPGSSKRPAAGCLASTSTRGWLTWRGGAGSRSRSRSSKAGTPPPEVAEGFSVVYHRVLPELPFNWAKPVLDTYSVLFAKAADGTQEAGAFGDSQQWRFDWERSYTRDEWLDQVPTHGGHSQLPPAKLETLLAGIAAAIDAVRAASRCATPRWWSPRCEPMAPDTTLRSIYPVPAGRRGPTAPWRDAGPAAGCSLRSGTPGAATPRPPRPAGRAPGGRRASGTSPGRRPPPRRGRRATGSTRFAGQAFSPCPTPHAASLLHRTRTRRSRPLSFRLTPSGWWPGTVGTRTVRNVRAGRFRAGNDGRYTIEPCDDRHGPTGGRRRTACCLQRIAIPAWSASPSDVSASRPPPTSHEHWRRP